MRLDAAAKARLLAEATRLYDAVFDRDLDRSEVEVLVQHVTDGELDLAGLAGALIGSDEYATRYGELTDTEFVARAYQNTFGRTPDTEELSGHLNDLSGGTISRAELVAELAQSVEHVVVGNGYGDTKNADVFLLPLEEEDKVTLSFDPDGSETDGDTGGDTDTGGTNVLAGTAGDDTLEIGDHEVLLGLDGNDILVGGDADDTLVGGDGDDRLIAKDGDDRLEGGKGNDILQGGVGNDTYVYNLGDGHDVIEDSGSTTGETSERDTEESSDKDVKSGDTLELGEGIALQDLDIRLVGDDLRIGFREPTTEEATRAADLGLPPREGSITIKGWATSDDNRIETLKLGDGTTIDLADRNFVMGGGQGTDSLSKVDGPVTRQFHDLNGDGTSDITLTSQDGRIWTKMGDGNGGYDDAVEQGAGINRLKKVAGENAFDTGAASLESFSGAGSLTTTAAQTDKSVIVGLSYEGSAGDQASIDFGIYLNSIGEVHLTESGTLSGPYGDYVVGDIFTVSRFADGNVQYLKNGTVFHTSSVTSDVDKSLFADTSLAHVGAELGDTILKVGDGPAELVTWVHGVKLTLLGMEETVSTAFTDLNSDGHTDAILTAEDGRIWTRLGDGEGGFGEAVDQSDGITNALVKTSGGDGWNKGAYSEESFVGAGSVSANALQTDKHVMFGLSSDAADSGYASINYAILMHADGKLYVYEDGNSLGEFGPYEIGDTPSVERLDDGTVQYLNNGEVFYSSTVTSDSDVPLKADLSINNNGTPHW